jgi:hypothetical protein
MIAALKKAPPCPLRGKTKLFRMKEVWFPKQQKYCERLIFAESLPTRGDEPSEDVPDVH